MTLEADPRACSDPTSRFLFETVGLDSGLRKRFAKKGHAAVLLLKETPGSHVRPLRSDLRGRG